jgi:AraC-like DNA-binding protein
MPASVLPGLCNLGMIDTRGGQDWGFEPHRNEGVEIVYLETGHMSYTANDQRHTLRAGDIIITRPWELHTMGDPNLGPGMLHWLNIDVGIRHPGQPWSWPPWIMLAPSDMRELTHRLRLNDNPIWKSTADIRHAFRELALGIRQYDKEKTVSRLTIHVNYLLMGLLEALRKQSRQDYPEVVSRERTVDLFLTGLNHSPQRLQQPWTLDSMATHCGLKPTAFVEYCRRMTNMSPISYLTRCRLDLAAQRLRAEMHVPVTRIALECGFNTSQYFATCFRQKYGQSPRAYRLTSPPV